MRDERGDRVRRAEALAGATFDVVTVASSLGSLAALTGVLSALPAGFPAPIVVVRHLHCEYPGLGAELLGQHTPLEVGWAGEGEELRPGKVYLAPPGRHLLVESGGVLALSESEKVNFSRPAADVLFCSVAKAYGPRALAVVLTGTGCDGAAGGMMIAQDEATSEAFGMPSAAAATGCVDFVLPLGTIPAALISLTMVGWVAPLFGLPEPPPDAGSRLLAPGGQATRSSLPSCS